MHRADGQRRVRVVLVARGNPCHTSLNFSATCPSDHLPHMNRKSKDDEASKEKHALSIERYIPILLIALKHSRMWPAESFSTRKMVLLTGLVVTIIAIIFLNILSEIALITVSVEGDKIVDGIGVLLTHVGGTLKWCYCIARNGRLYEIAAKLDRCHMLCQRIDSTREGYEVYKCEMERARQHSNILFCSWLCAVYMTIFQWCIGPIVLGTWKIYLVNDTFTERDLPYVGWFPLDSKNFYTYIFLYMIEAIGMYSCTFAMVCYDIFYVSMVMIICAQFRYINITLTKTDFVKNKSASKAIFILNRRLQNCVDCHAEILEFIEMLQTFASPMMFEQCIGTLFILFTVSFETTAVKFTIDKENIFVLCKLIEYFLAAAIQLCFFCFIATYIQHLASQVPQSVYSCGWEIIIFEQKKELNTKRQFKYVHAKDIDRLVQMIIMQAQRPIVLTGGPFYVLSMETFRAIMSMAISNSIMLRQLSNRNE